MRTGGGFGPVHDLTHLVVEKSLGIRNGFLGLLAQGREIQDFDRNSKAWLTSDAYTAEVIAGQMSLEFATCQPLSVDDFNWAIRANSGTEVTAEQLASMRAQLDELVAQWRAIAPGETLELDGSVMGD